MADISIDPKYEYDAPVYVDFASVALDQLENDGADEWFDNRLEDDLDFDDSFKPLKPARKAQVKPDESDKTASNVDSAPSQDAIRRETVCIEPAKTEEPTPPQSTEKEEHGVDKSEAPQCTEHGADESEAPQSTAKEEHGADESEAKKLTTAEPSQGEGESEVKSGGVKLGKRTTGQRANELLECMAKAKRESAEGESSMAAAAKEQAFDKEPKPKKDRRSVRDASQKATSNIHHILKKPRTPSKPTVHATVSDANRQPSQTKKTTEELQLEEVRRMQKEAKKKLQQSRRSYLRLAKSTGPVVVKGSKPTTQTMEFNFHTKDRDRSSRPGSASKKDAVNPANFPQTLRNFSSADNYNPNFNHSKKPPTPDHHLKMKPFKFHLDERFKSKPAPSSSGKVVPTAEAIQKFQKATPPRFRSNPGSVTKKWKINPNDSGHSTTSSGSGNSDESASSFGGKLTVPVTPNLKTRGRSRPVTAKSAADEEEEVVASMKEYHFKAKPINPNIFIKGGLHGVPRKKEEVHLTEAHTPPLATKERSLKRKAEEMTDGGSEEGEEEDQTVFHAQPMPDFSKVTGLPVKKLVQLTQAESPAFALKRRRLNNNSTTESESEGKEEASGDRVIRANPMPNMDRAFQPQLPHKKVETKPFSFEERDKNKPNRETLVEMILRKEKKPDFKAQPLPNFGDAPDLPPKALPHVTQIKPFNLETDIRGEHYIMKHQEKVEKETRELKEAAEFKAQAPSVLHKEPFVPQKVDRPLLTVDNVVLHSEVRSEQRAKFDAKRVREEYQRMTENLQRRALRAKEESIELAKYRKQLVHKAQPVHHSAPMIIKPSERQLAKPLSPHFHTDDRLRARHGQ